MNFLKNKNREEQDQLKTLGLILLVGIGYYLFFFLPEQRSNAKRRIETIFQYHQITTQELDSNLWKGFKSYKEKLDKLYLPTQISKFSENMTEAIETRKRDIEERKFRNVKEAKDNVIKNIKEFAEKEIEKLPSFEKEVKKFCKRINQASADDISSISDEANNFITQQKNKRQKLHWLREPKNWAYKKIKILESDFDQAWNQLNGLVNPHNEPNKEPEKCIFASSYKINFPSSLWNDLTEEQRNHEKSEELRLRDEVKGYAFNPKVIKWYDKVLNNPVRGERDESNIDNNAILYGAPRTGKSIIMEKLAYEADIYPLVVIQGSGLTPTINDQKCGIDNFKKFIYTICDINNTLVDDFGFERNPESGEPQYIFFIDEANQVSENTFMKSPSGLTFLKECMGSDNYKKNESLNLWTVATNHLNEIEEAVYQPGRLGNQLSFNWTIGKFKDYAADAGIINNFPQHWIDTISLNEEDNKLVSRFNIIHFEESFLGRKINGENIPDTVSFWNNFINNEDNKKILNDKKIIDESGEEIVEKKGIQFGEMLDFFWQKFDNGELWDEDFNGKFEKLREKEIEKIITATNQISKSIDLNLKAINETIEATKNEIKIANNVFDTALRESVEKITGLLSEIGSKIK